MRSAESESAMLGFLDPFARRLVRHGIRRGLVEGSAPWIVVALAVAIVRFALRPERPLVAKADLALGESIVVTHVPSPEREPKKSRRNRSRKLAGVDGELMHLSQTALVRQTGNNDR